MKTKSTLIILGLVLGLFACSRNSGVLENAKPDQSLQNTALKSCVESGKGKLRLHFRSINSYASQFDSAGGKLTAIILVRKGNERLGIQTKRDTVWTQVEYFDDLLHMQTGIMGDLGLLTIPAGAYDYAVVPVSEGWAAKDGKIYPVIFPRNKMILAFNPPVIVGEGLSPDLILNIDVSRSFVPIRHGHAFIFKPIVKVVNATTTGSLVGMVYDASSNTPIPDAHVYVTVDGNTYDTYTLNQYYVDSLGQPHYPGEYWIPGIPAGPSTAYAAKAGYVTATAPVSILEGNFNFQNFTLTPQ
jgi:hypothetical protein